MNIKCRALAMILTIVMLISCFFFAAFAESASFEDTGEMNYDVIFVLDGSWSMNYSDPHDIAEEAAELFSDMCDSSTCRMGYVVYSHEIVAEQGLAYLNTDEAKSAFNEALDAIEHPAYSYTDIPLGLTEALNIFNEENLSVDRQPMIVLLSDGGLSLPDDGRSYEEANAEMDATLTTLADKRIPVYTIGLKDPDLEQQEAEENNLLDPAYLQDISDRTEGTSYITDTANDLPEIIDEIFADFNHISAVECPVVWDPDNGDYVATFNIENNSVCMANIVVLGSDVSEPRIYTPGGSAVSIDGENVVSIQSDNYMLLKLMFPERGDWTLRIRGYEGNAPTVSLLSSYSLYCEQELDKTIADVNETVNIRAALFDGTGELPVQDEDLLAQLIANCNVMNAAGAVVDTIPMTLDEDGYFNAAYTIPSYGYFRFVTTISSVTNTFSKTSESAILNSESVFDSESIYLKQTVDQTEVTAGSSFTVHADLLDGVLTTPLSMTGYEDYFSGVCSITRPSGMEDSVALYLNDQGSFSCDYTPDEVGTYTVNYVSLASADGLFSWTSASAPISVSVAKAPPQVTEEVYLTVRSKPLATTDSFSIDRYVTWNDDAEISWSFEDYYTDGLVEVEEGNVYNGHEVVVTGVKSGDCVFPITVTDANSGSADLLVHVTVTNGWIPLLIGIGIALLVIIVIVVVIVLINKAKPKFSDALTIALILPSDQRAQMPAAQRLTNLGNKHKVNIGKLIDENPNAQRALKNAIKTNNLAHVLNGIVFVARDKDKPQKVRVTYSGGHGYQWNSETSKQSMEISTGETISLRSDEAGLEIRLTYGKANKATTYGGGFGTSFGSQTGYSNTLNSNGGFGAGTQQGTVPNFGSFGAGQQGTVPNFGSFGTGQQSSVPDFSSFGAAQPGAQQSSVPDFSSFGAAQPAAQQSSVPDFSSFGAAQPAAQQSTVPDFSGFGAPQPGAQQSTVPDFSSFGAAQPGAQQSSVPNFSSFGAAQPGAQQSAVPDFSSFSAAQPGAQQSTVPDFSSFSAGQQNTVPDFNSFISDN